MAKIILEAALTYICADEEHLSSLISYFLESIFPNLFILFFISLCLDTFSIATTEMLYCKKFGHWDWGMHCTAHPLDKHLFLIYGPNNNML